MYEPLKSAKNQDLPSKSKFARTFRILSRISYWIHIILGAVSFGSANSLGLLS